MQLHSETDHIAILSLMISGLLLRRLHDLGQVDEETERHLHHLVQAVRGHAALSQVEDLNILFDNIDRSLSSQRRPAA